MSLQTSLQSLGLNPTEITAYTALLQMGSGTVQEIVRKSGLKRTTAYGALEDLIAKKLVILTKTRGKQEYTAQDPQQLIKLLKQEAADFANDRKSVLEILPELLSLYKGQSDKPKIRFYEGRENMKEVFKEILLSPRGSELLGYSSVEEISEGWWSDFARYFIERRIERGITDRSIIENAPFTRELQRTDKEGLRNTILIEQNKYPLHGHLFIYGNSLLIASFKDQATLVIENKHLADTEKSLFKLARIGAAEVGLPSPNPYVKPKDRDGH